MTQRYTRRDMKRGIRKVNKTISLEPEVARATELLAAELTEAKGATVSASITIEEILMRDRHIKRLMKVAAKELKNKN